MRLLFLPMAIAMALLRSPRSFYRVQALMLGLTLVLACAWLAAGFAIAAQFGFLATLLWLIPTAAAVFGMGVLNKAPG